MEQSDDIQSILNSKVALKYRGIEVEAMKAIATAHQNRSLQEFELALATYREGTTAAAVLRRLKRRSCDFSGELISISICNV